MANGTRNDNNRKHYAKYPQPGSSMHDTTILREARINIFRAQLLWLGSHDDAMATWLPQGNSRARRTRMAVPCIEHPHPKYIRTRHRTCKLPPARAHHRQQRINSPPKPSAVVRQRRESQSPTSTERRRCRRRCRRQRCPSYISKSVGKTCSQGKKPTSRTQRVWPATGHVGTLVLWQQQLR